MSGENSILNYEDLEKKAGQKAARTLQRNWKNILGTATVKQTGTLLRNSHVKAKMKFGELESITIHTTSVAMKLNYGYERIAENGRIMTNKRPGHYVGSLFDKSQATIEKLAQELAEIKGHEVATKIIS